MGANESGQSLLETLILIPFMVGFTYFLSETYGSIQTSIVNQQYTRALAFDRLIRNAAIYPINYNANNFNNANQFIVGVTSQNIGPTNNTELVPKSPYQKVRVVNTRNSQNVKIRSTITLCTPTFYTASQQAATGLDFIGNYCAPGDAKYE